MCSLKRHRQYLPPTCQQHVHNNGKSYGLWVISSCKWFFFLAVTQEERWFKCGFKGIGVRTLSNWLYMLIGPNWCPQGGGRCVPWHDAARIFSLQRQNCTLNLLEGGAPFVLQITFVYKVWRKRLPLSISLPRFFLPPTPCAAPLIPCEGREKKVLRTPPDPINGRKKKKKKYNLLWI